jgi:hypothetical protein
MLDEPEPHGNDHALAAKTKGDHSLDVEAIAVVTDTAGVEDSEDLISRSHVCGSADEHRLERCERSE